jgi:hypothetical protein
MLATVVITDIIDSIKRADTRGDRAWRDLLEAHDMTGLSAASFSAFAETR